MSYTPREIAVGEKLTGANVDSDLDAIGTAMSSIDASQFDADAKFDIAQMAQKYSRTRIPVAAIKDVQDGTGNAVVQQWTAPADGVYDGVDYYDHGTGNAIAVTREGTTLSGGEAVTEGDVFTITAGAGVVGTVAFRMVLV